MCVCVCLDMFIVALILPCKSIFGSDINERANEQTNYENVVYRQNTLTFSMAKIETHKNIVPSTSNVRLHKRVKAFLRQNL